MNNINVDDEGYMVDKVKTKSEMLFELESIKGLLLEEDSIPILQEVIEQPSEQIATPSIQETAAQTARRIYLEQQDFFNGASMTDSATQLLDTISDLEHAASSLDKTNNDAITKHIPSLQRPSVTKAAGENPFLPEHIRSRLHGNNPPPLFEIQTARKIARVSRPVTQLGNTQQHSPITRKAYTSQQDLIDDLMDSLLPEIEKELRQRLEKMSKENLERLARN